MALKPIIYKAYVSLNQMDTNEYQNLQLTLALHPSETLERMMARLLAYCFNVHEFLQFTQGLSTPNEPDIQAVALNDECLLWIDVGEPSADRIKKATRKARQVKVYTFNSKSDEWWSQESKKIRLLDAEIIQLNWKELQCLAQWVERRMDISITISGQHAFVAMNKGEQDIHWKQLA